LQLAAEQLIGAGGAISKVTEKLKA